MPLMVNGEPVADAAIARQRSLLEASLTPADRAAARHDPRLRRIAEENAVLQVLLHQAAASRSPEITSDEVAAEIALRRGTPQSTTCSPGERAAIVQSLQVGGLINEITRRIPRPRSHEIEAAYRLQRDRFRVPETRHVRHIVVNIDGGRDEQAARAIMQQAEAALASGEPFAHVADRFSDCAGGGGDLGWLPRGEMVQAFEEVVFALRPNTLSPIFQTIFGLHIATVEAQRAPRQQALSEVRNVLARELHEDRRQAALFEYLRDLAARSDIRHTEENS